MDRVSGSRYARLSWIVPHHIDHDHGRSRQIGLLAEIVQQQFPAVEQRKPARTVATSSSRKPRIPGRRRLRQQAGGQDQAVSSERCLVDVRICSREISSARGDCTPYMLHIRPGCRSDSQRRPEGGSPARGGAPPREAPRFERGSVTWPVRGTLLATYVVNPVSPCSPPSTAATSWPAMRWRLLRPALCEWPDRRRGSRRRSQRLGDLYAGLTRRLHRGPGRGHRRRPAMAGSTTDESSTTT